MKESNRDVLLWAVIVLIITSVGITPKCFKCFLKLFSRCRGRIADDGQDGNDNGHDIHLK